MPKRFLIARLSSLGDVVHTLPTAGSLRQAYPDSHITWAVDPRFKGIVDCCTHVDEVVVVKPGLLPNSWPVVPGDYDAALDMQGLFKSGIVVARSKAKAKVGFHWQREGSSLFSSAVKPDATSLHVVDQYVDVARSLGGADDATFGLVPKSEDRAYAQTLLSGIERPLALLNAGAGWATKRWPIAHCAALLDQLYAFGMQGALLGGKAEEDHKIAEEVLAVAKQPVVNLVGKTSVSQLVALISLAKAHVGGDTGSSHVAAALGVPAIGLYSITRPERSCPYGQFSRCLYNQESLSMISPESVFAKLKESLC